MLNQIARTVVRRISQNGTRGYHGPPSDFKPPTMNELPVPQGSWQKNYEAKQKVYNMQLAVGIALMSCTLSYIIFSDRFFFNAFPPKEPKGNQ